MLTLNSRISLECRTAATFRQEEILGFRCQHDSVKSYIFNLAGTLTCRHTVTLSAEPLKYVTVILKGLILTEGIITKGSQLKVHRYLHIQHTVYIAEMHTKGISAIRTDLRTHNGYCHTQH